jgi:hypothetical protein
MDKQDLNRQWTHHGKVYDTAASDVMGTKKGSFDMFDDDGGVSMIETLYRTKDGEAFAHNICTHDNGKVEHSMFICKDGGKAWMATLRYADKYQH